MIRPSHRASKSHLPTLLLGLPWLLACGAVQAGGTQGEALAGLARTSAGLPDCVAHCGSTAGHAGEHGQAKLVAASTPTLFNPGDGPDTSAGANFDALAQVQEPGVLSLAIGSALEPLAQSLPAASPGAVPGVLAGREPTAPQPTLGLVLLAALGLGALGVQAHVRKGNRRR